MYTNNKTATPKTVKMLPLGGFAPFAPLKDANTANQS